MKMVNGLAFPDADEFMVNETDQQGHYQMRNLTAALRHVRTFRTALDGGAHVGTWSAVMSERFGKVLAFEPSPDTYECLVHNLREHGHANVDTYQAALGAEPGRVSMALDPANAARKNTGARHVAGGSEIQVVTIDSFGLTDLDFLKLDIEGSEPMALTGAMDTLNRCRPVVLFENKRLWTRYFGMPKDAVSRLLTAIGYHLVEAVSMDQIWAPRLGRGLR